MFVAIKHKIAAEKNAGTEETKLVSCLLVQLDYCGKEQTDVEKPCNEKGLCGVLLAEGIEGGGSVDN